MLKLKYDAPPSHFALNLNLRRPYTPGHRFEAQMPPNVDLITGGEAAGAEGFTGATRDIFASLDALGGRVLEALAVRRCSVTPG